MASIRAPAPSDALVAYVRFLTTTRLVAVSQCPGVNTLRWAATMRGRADSAQVDTHCAVVAKRCGCVRCRADSVQECK